MIEALKPLVWLGLVCCLALAIGAWVLKRMKVPSDGPPGHVGLSLGIGLGVISFGILFIGLAGWLYRSLVLIALALAWLACWKPFVETMGRLAAWMRRWRQARWSWEERGYLVGIGLAFVLIWLGTLLPEADGDSLFYHLGDPKYFVQHHRIEPIRYSSNSLFPYAIEMLFTLSLLLDSVALAKGMNLVFAVILAMGLYAVVRARWSRVAALRVTSLGVVTPAIGTQAATTYAEMGLACYLLLAVMAVTRWLRQFYASFDLRVTSHETRTTRLQRESKSWLLLSGLFLGMVLSIKNWLGIMFAFAFLLALLGELAKRQMPVKLSGRGVITIALLAIALCGIWYVRAWLYWGNPLYPFTLPGVPLPATGDVLHLKQQLGLGKGLAAWLFRPWHGTISPEAFHGNNTQWGPVFLALLPGACLAARSLPHLRFFVLFVGISLGLWFLSLQALRYLLPLLPVVAWFYAPFLDQLTRWPRWGKRAILAMLSLGLVINLGILGYFHRAGLGLLTGWLTPHEHLLKVERSYPAAQWVNAHLPADAKVLLVGELRQFYFDRELILELFYHRVGRYDEEARSGEEVISRLKAEGVTHLVVRKVDDPTQVPESPEGLRVPALVNDPKFVRRYLTLLAEVPYETPVNQQGRFDIYAIR